MKNQYKMIGYLIGGILTISAIVCFIVNLAIGHRLDWFYIVLASLILVASITVLPFMVIKNRLMWTLAGFTGSLLLLLLVISIYSGGDWFFLVASLIVFGLSIIFMPYLAFNLPFFDPIKNHKGLFIMIWDTICLYGVILVIGFYTDTVHYLRNAISITTFSLLLPWFLFLLIRYLDINKFTKTGLSIFLISLYFLFINDFVSYVIDGEKGKAITQANLLSWKEMTIDVNIRWIVFVLGIILSLFFIIMGFLKK